MNKKLFTVSVSLFLTLSAFAGEAPSNFDVYFQASDEATALDRQVLAGSETSVGALTEIFICVSSQIATNKLSEKMSEVLKKTTEEAFNSVAMGKEILEEMLKRDPKFLNFEIEQVPAVVACQKEIAKAHQDSRVTDQHIRAIVRLAQVGGTALGRELTSGF